jgi:hypothetical protein
LCTLYPPLAIAIPMNAVKIKHTGMTMTCTIWAFHDLA